jgi:16S rRNA U1498 N3-methylase RsmE
VALAITGSLMNTFIKPVVYAEIGYRKKVDGKIVNKTLAAGEPRTRITLYQALLKASNFEVVLQKCIQLSWALHA